jgi:hypothetical protein
MWPTDSDGGDAGHPAEAIRVWGFGLVHGAVVHYDWPTDPVADTD